MRARAQIHQDTRTIYTRQAILARSSDIIALRASFSLLFVPNASELYIVETRSLSISPSKLFPSSLIHPRLVLVSRRVNDLINAPHSYFSFLLNNLGNFTLQGKLLLRSFTRLFFGTWFDTIIYTSSSIRNIQHLIESCLPGIDKPKKFNEKTKILFKVVRK